MYGLALEQGRRKVEEINSGRSKHEDLCFNQTQAKCIILKRAPCTSSPTHAEGDCPGRNCTAISATLQLMLIQILMLTMTLLKGRSIITFL